MALEADRGGEFGFDTLQGGLDPRQERQGGIFDAVAGIQNGDGLVREVGTGGIGEFHGGACMETGNVRIGGGALSGGGLLAGEEEF